MISPDFSGHALYRTFKDRTNWVELSVQWRERGTLSAFFAMIGKRWDNYSTHRQEEPDNMEKRKTVLKECRISCLHLGRKSRSGPHLPWSFLFNYCFPSHKDIWTTLVSSIGVPEWPIGVWSHCPSLYGLWDATRIPTTFLNHFLHISFLWEQESWLQGQWKILASRQVTKKGHKEKENSLFLCQGREVRKWEHPRMIQTNQNKDAE